MLINLWIYSRDSYPPLDLVRHLPAGRYLVGCPSLQVLAHRCLFVVQSGLTIFKGVISLSLKCIVIGIYFIVQYSGHCTL